MQPPQSQVQFAEPDPHCHRPETRYASPSTTALPIGANTPPVIVKDYALLDWIGRYGKERGCTSLHLDSGVQRHAAHRFYLRERMDIVFYHFRKAL